MNQPQQHLRNPGTDFDLSWVRQQRVNQPAVLRRVAQLNGSRSVKKEYQAAWLVRALQCVDLTTLSGDDTPGRVHRLCAKARQPLRVDLMQALGLTSLYTGAVCVYQDMIEPAIEALKGSGIPVAAVSTAFPAGLVYHHLKIREIEASVSAGAQEIDIVITRKHVLTGNWQALYQEVRDYRAASGDAHLKAILATGDLQTLENVARASWVAMMAGADFIKTSTGKESINATFPVSLVMVRAIRHFAETTGYIVGYKPAGGISTAKSALQYLALIKEELGNEWLTPTRFRIGASSLLTDIERQLDHHVTGHYSAAHRHALP